MKAIKFKKENMTNSSDKSPLMNKLLDILCLLIQNIKKLKKFEGTLENFNLKPKDLRETCFKEKNN